MDILPKAIYRFNEIPIELLQFSPLETSMDCIVHGVAYSQTWLSDFHLLTHSLTIKLLKIFFTELEQINPKIYMEPWKTPNRQSNPEEKEQSWKHNPPDFRQYYKTIGIKTAWYWSKNRQMDHWNRIESP